MVQLIALRRRPISAEWPHRAARQSDSVSVSTMIALREANLASHSKPGISVEKMRRQLPVHSAHITAVKEAKSLRLNIVDRRAQPQQSERIQLDIVARDTIHRTTIVVDFQN
ncbi:MAG: hypothetical protein ACLQAT_20640 [Candidatus Binataceae bacterium]